MYKIFLTTLILHLLHTTSSEAQQAYMLKDINPTGNSNPHSFILFRNTLFFQADDGIHGRQLWKTGGTATSTVMVKIFTDPSGDDPTIVNDWLYFRASDGNYDFELWKTNGTSAGTARVADIYLGSESSYPENLTNVNGRLFFSADDGVHGKELWISDGLPSGTRMVKDINDGIDDSDLSNFISFHNMLFFTADDGVHGEELWRSDGTLGGTVMVKDITPNENRYTQAQELTVVNNTLFFRALDENLGTWGKLTLWKTDGTTGGTEKVYDINPSSLTNVNGTLFFAGGFASGFPNTFGIELWKSDGTEAGTELVRDINPTGNSGPDYLTNVNGTLFFAASDGTSNAQLWISDGSAMGTTMVQGDFLQMCCMENVNGTLYFQADDGAHGYEPWRSNGSEVSTQLVQDIDPVWSSHPTGFINREAAIYFSANDGVHGDEVWVIPQIFPAPAINLFLLD